MDVEESSYLSPCSGISWKHICSAEHMSAHHDCFQLERANINFSIWIRFRKWTFNDWSSLKCGYGEGYWKSVGLNTDPIRRFWTWCFWRQDLCCLGTTSLEQSFAQSQTMWAVIRPVQAVTGDIFIRTVRRGTVQCELFLTALNRSILTHLLSYLLNFLFNKEKL